MSELAPAAMATVSASPVGHVLHVADRTVLARFGAALVTIARGLCARGVRTSLLTNDPRIVARLAGTPVECHTVPCLSYWRPWRLDADLAARFDPPPDVVQVWDLAGLWWVQRWTARVGAPLFVFASGLRMVPPLLRSSRSDRHFLLPSRTLAPLLARGLPISGDRYRILHPPVESPCAAEPPATARGTASILCVSPLGAGHGLEILIDAVAQLRRDQFDVQLALVGPDRGIVTVWRHIRARGVRERVSLVDEPNLWERVIPEIDACVVPAAEEELCLAPLLAMALGKTVIAARHQLGEWFIEDRTAWQFTPGSATELAYLLVRAIERPQQAAALGASAAAYVRAHHDPPAILDDLLTIYQAAVAQRRSTAGTAPANH